MTRREQLQEQYEDALFALLMDELAATEGQAALEENERLKNDPEYAVPTDVRQRCLKTISRCCTKKTLRRTGRVLCRGFGRVAVIGMICMLLFTTAFAVSPTLRANTLNLVMEVFEDSTAFSFSSSDSGSPSFSEDFDVDVNVNWVPEGYTLVDQSEDPFLSSLRYRSETGDEILINIFKGENGVLNIDTENAQVEPVTIQGCDGLLVLKDGDAQLVWGNENGPYKVGIIAKNTETEEDVRNLMKIAENLTFEID